MPINRPPYGEPLRTLTIKDLAAILNKSEKTVSNDLYRAPHRLPPRLRFGNKGPALWRYDTVITWLAEREEKALGRQEAK